MLGRVSLKDSSIRNAQTNTILLVRKLNRLRNLQSIECTCNKYEYAVKLKPYRSPVLSSCHHNSPDPMLSIGQPRLFLSLYDWFSFSSMSFRHRTTMPIASATASLSLSITWLSTRANLSGCHLRNAARILSFDETSGECADDNRNSRIDS